MKSRVETDYVTERIRNEHIQLESFIRKHVAETSGNSGIGRALVYQMGFLVTLLEINITRSDLARLVDKRRHPFLIQPLKIHGEKTPHRIALQRKAATGNHLHHRRVSL